MAFKTNDELVINAEVGNVGQLTEIEEDSDISCVFVYFDCHRLLEEGADSLYFTKADLFRMLAELEES